MIDIRDKVTLITPVRVTNPHSMNNLRETLLSYATALKDDYPKHLIADATPREWDGRVREAFDRIVPGRWKDVSHNTSMYQGTKEMVAQVETPYTSIVLTDVMSVAKRNFLAPIIEGMELDKSILHTRVGGDPLGCGRPFNTSPFESDGSGVFFKGEPDRKFRMIQVGGDVLWVYPKLAQWQRKFFFAVWSSVFRTDGLKKIVDSVPGDIRTLANLEAHINGVPDWVNYDVPGKGWPTAVGWLENWNQATLNMAAYVYAMDREQKQYQDFMETSTKELKEVPPAGEITWPKA